MFSPEILKKSPVSTLDIRVLLKDPSMEDAQRLRLLGFGSDLPQAPGVLVGRVLASLAFDGSKLSISQENDDTSQKTNEIS